MPQGLRVRISPEAPHHSHKEYAIVRTSKGVFTSSSMEERSAVNRMVAGSSPAS